jgi:pyruvate dehydrogenase E2 component (dihydrolipoamide acetyltransferase)
MSGTWQMMARRTTESWQQAPHFFLTREVDAGNLQAWRRQARQRIDGLTVSDLLVLLIARTLRDHPRVNAAWVNERIVLNEQINVGLAVAVEDGLLVPVIYQADRLGLRELMARRAAVAEMAAKGRLTLADVRDATFTVSNLGMFGVDSFQAILNPPQAAILAVGRIADRIVPVDGLPAVRPMMTLTLSCDHRVLDGARAARFLEQLVRLIEDPLASLD